MSQIDFSAINIPKPCAIEWDDMQGNNLQRFCNSCQKTVHNITSMTSDAYQGLLAANAGNVCVTINPLSRMGWQASFRQMITLGLLTVSLLALLLVAANASTSSSPSLMGDVAEPQQCGTQEPQHLMGKPAVNSLQGEPVPQPLTGAIAPPSKNPQNLRGRVAPCNVDKKKPVKKTTKRAVKKRTK